METSIIFQRGVAHKWVITKHFSAASSSLGSVSYSQKYMCNKQSFTPQKASMDGMCVDPIRGDRETFSSFSFKQQSYNVSCSLSGLHFLHNIATWTALRQNNGYCSATSIFQYNSPLVLQTINAVNIAQATTATSNMLTACPASKSMQKLFQQYELLSSVQRKQRGPTGSRYIRINSWQRRFAVHVSHISTTNLASLQLIKLENHTEHYQRNNTDSCCCNVLEKFLWTDRKKNY